MISARSMLAGIFIGLATCGASAACAQQAPAETSMGAVLFAADSDEITPAAAKALDGIAARFKDPKTQRVLVRGHSEPREHAAFGPQYGVGLSQRRAANVRSYLTGRGIPDGALTTEAFGDSRPIKGTSAIKLRRVEIFFGPGPGW